MTGDLLTPRALNRATLKRQLLLERSATPVLAAVEHLVGLQAQVPLNPYLGLWSRLHGFRPDDLAQLLIDRQVVRIVVMRATLHLVSADDCLVLRPLMQPVLDGELSRHREVAPAIAGVDLAPVLASARRLFEDRPLTGGQLRKALAERFPDLDASALAYACRNLLPLVQVPPRGVWGQTSQVTSTTAESWLGRPMAEHPSIDDVVLRYLAAFGPATVADVTAWSRLTGQREVVERLRTRLRIFRDDRGRELFDLPDAPRPDPDTPSPPRFLPEYDNVLLSHADRSRFAPETGPARSSFGPGPVHGAVLCDGRLCATWHLDRATVGDATLVIDCVVPLTKRDIAAIEAEGLRMVGLLAPETTADVRFHAIP